MKIAIIDDSIRDFDEIKNYLNTYQKSRDLQFEIVGFSLADDFLAEYKEKAFDLDLVIMDIDMPGTNGVDAARILRSKDPNVVLMFVTNMPQYAMVGFEVEAVDYVLKPVKYETFELKITKALRYIRRNKPEKLPLETSDGIKAILVSDIYYVETVLHYLIFHTKDGEFKVRQTMGKLEARLKDYQFARCNSGYLVNLAHVDSINKDDVFVKGDILKISRGKKRSFMESFTRYLGGFQQ